MASKELKDELKEKIIKALNFEDMKPEDIGDLEPLFADGLGLDSVDALEIILLLEKDYGIKFKAAADAKPYLSDISTLANLIEDRRKEWGVKE